jgi:hypothetical protein
MADAADRKSIHRFTASNKNFLSYSKKRTNERGSSPRAVYDAKYVIKLNRVNAVRRFANGFVLFNSTFISKPVQDSSTNTAQFQTLT